jgi:hypothetical protein
VRPWLFAIARNRCRSIHAARKDVATPDADVEPVTDGLSADVEQRSDLRALLADIEQLPEDQRSALVLAELADMPHAEIGAVIGVPGSKVKALVHQARTHLIAERDARETPCERIRAELEAATGGALRRGALRRHLRQCEPCSAYRRSVARLRSGHPVILPVGVSAAVLDGAAGGSASDRPRRPGSQRQPRRRTRSPTPARSIAATAAGVVRSPANRRHRARVMPSEQPP